MCNINLVENNILIINTYKRTKFYVELRYIRTTSFIFQPFLNF